MHRLRFVLVLLVTLTLVSLAEIRLSLSGGFSSPSKPQNFTEGWTTGFGATTSLSFRLSPKTRLSFELAYSVFPRDDSKAVTATTSYLAKRIAFLTAHLGIRFLPTSTPEEGGLYLVGSAGFFRGMSNGPYAYVGSGYYAVATSGESALSITTGLGVLIPAGTSTNFFLEGRYAMAFTDGGAKCYFPFRAGLEFGF